MSQDIPTSVGLKVGSQNTAFAYRNNGRISTSSLKTCVRYPKTIKKTKILDPVVGDVAAKYADGIWPLVLGGIDTDEGVEHTRHILKSISMPHGVDLVLAAPAAEVNNGKKRLAEVVKEVFNPNNNEVSLFSEALCSVIAITGGTDTVVDSTIIAANLGSSTLEIGCFNQAEIVHLSAHKEVSGNTVDSAIVNSITNAVGDPISIQEARRFKEETSLINPKMFLVQSSTRNGLIEAQVQDEVIRPIAQYADNVAEVLRIEILRNISPIIRKQALENPLFICGGMANIKGLPELITDRLSDKIGASIDVKYPVDGNSHVLPAIGAMMLGEAVRGE